MTRSLKLARLLADFGSANAKEPVPPPVPPALAVAGFVETESVLLDKIASAESEAGSSDNAIDAPDSAVAEPESIAGTAAIEAALAQAHAAHEAEMLRLRDELLGETADRLVGAIEAGRARLTEEIAGIVGRTLEVVLSAALVERSIVALGERLSDLATPGSGIRIRLGGSRVLSDMLAARFATRDWPLDFVEDGTDDLSVSFDSERIETRLGEWARALEGGDS